jgi:hypothetical protein
MTQLHLERTRTKSKETAIGILEHMRKLLLREICCRTKAICSHPCQQNIFDAGREAEDH